jgi:uncharacterized protein YkwD
MNLPRSRSSLFFVAVLMMVGIFLGAYPAVREALAVQIKVFPTTEEMERDLLLVLNRERESRHLSILRSAPELVALARKQSADMAATGVLSHLAASGKSMTERLAEADVFFAANGENVALSETFVAEFIHQSFMGSPDHRDNILHAEFDTVGIGVVLAPDNTYFVTVDFIRSLTPKPAAEIKDLVLQGLNEMRAKQNKPPVVLIDEIVRLAELFSRNKAAGQEIPKIPAFFGATIVHLVSGPVSMLVARMREDRRLTFCGRAGIGVLFARSPEYPGGAYFISVLLVADESSPDPGELTRLGTVFKAANALRIQDGREPLELDFELVERADQAIALWKKGGDTGDAVTEREELFFSTSQPLDKFPKALQNRLQDPSVRRIGISTVRIMTPGVKTVRYAVAIVFDR